MYRIYRGLFQTGMKIGNYVMGYRLPEYISGRGFLNRLPQMLKEKDAGKVLVVTDEGLVKIGLAERVADLLEKAGIEYAVFHAVEQNPTSDNVEAGFRAFRGNACDSVVAVGGGSPMDCAKAICAKAAHPKKSVKQLQGLLKGLLRLFLHQG
jgi:alcohol dehydrogenase class IV